MADVKVGLDQINNPAPKGWRRFSNATIMFLLPGLVGLVQGLKMSSDMRNNWMMVLAFAPAAIKFVSSVLGNGQYFDEKKVV